MTTQVKYTKAMLGYGLWVIVEDTLRNWLSERLIQLYGTKWTEQIPTGIWNKLHERYNESVKVSNLSQAREMIEHSDFPDLFDIVQYRKQYKIFLPDISIEDIKYYNEKLYTLRNQLAHKPYGFTLRSLDNLIECAEWIARILENYGQNLLVIINDIKEHPELYAQEIPDDFILSVQINNQYRVPNNLPPMDYEYDGGFVGRKNERQDIKKKLLNKRIHPVLTISGAGGVGKTALAHHICDEILLSRDDIFDGVIWISAKKDRLTVTGIEELEQPIQSFEDIVNTTLETFGFSEYTELFLKDKVELINDIILSDTEKGVLLVIDNLETILHEKELVEFIKEVPLPNKILITSRLGLGEIERRIPLKEMSSSDAIDLFRRISIEKSVKNLAQLPSETIKVYVEKMSAYPLVIKWVVGQAAINKDIDRIVQTINSTESDVSKFCFEYIYEQLLSDNAKSILLCLASSEEDLTQAALMDVTDLNIQEFEDVMLELELASLVVPDQRKDPDDQRIITRYGILPLTKAYLISRGESRQEIKEKLQSIQNLIENSKRAYRMYELSLEHYGAVTEAEKIASKHISTALTRNQARDYLGAVDALERAEEIAPTFSTIFRSRAFIEADNQNYALALDMYEKAARFKPNDPIIWFHWAKLEKDLDNYDSARIKLARTLDLVKHKASVLIELGNIETRDSDFNKAIYYYNEAINISQENRNTITDRDLIIAHTALAKTYLRWAEVYEKERQLDTALEKAHLGLTSMREAARYGSSDTKTVETEIKCLMMLGRIYKKTNNISQAVHFLELAIEQNKSTGIWSRKQKYYYIRACYLLITILMEDSLPDIEKVKHIYQLGKSYLLSDPSFEQKYMNLQLLFEDDGRFIGKFINVISDKGYGFIECPEADPGNVFVHISDIVDEIQDFSSLLGVNVSFSLRNNNKGSSAVAVRIIND